MIGVLRVGTEVNDRLSGGGGDDTIDGGAGRDTLTGGSGIDLFRFNATGDSTRTNPDGITDFEHGVDRIDLSGLGWGADAIVIGPGGRLKTVYSDASDRTYLRDTQSDFSFYLEGDHRGSLSRDDFVLADPKLLFLPIAGQSNGRGLRAADSDTESGVTRLEGGLSAATGFPVISGLKDAEGGVLDICVGSSSVMGLSTGTDAEKARSWWYVDTDQPGEALLRAVRILQDKVAEFSAIGHQVEMSLIWAQGENAATLIYRADDKEAAEQQYKAATLKVFDYFKEQLGSDLTFYLMQTGRLQAEAAENAGLSDYKIHSIADGMARVQDMQEQIALERDDVHIAVNYEDLPMAYEADPVAYPTDFFHMGEESKEIIGDRLADFIAMDKGFGHVLKDPGNLPGAALLDIDLQPAGASILSVTGSDQSDILVGSEGRDSMDGGAGNDTLIGGVGRDTLAGGSGDDVFFYQAGPDTDATGYDTIVNFTRGSDVIDLAAFGYTGIRQGEAQGSMLGYRFGGGDTFVRSADGLLLKLSGELSLSEADFVFAPPPEPPVPGLTLVGSGRNEKLAGTSDNDTIDGGAGKDILTGGDGADTFRFSHRADSSGSLGYDRITDFVDGVDAIDLRGLGYTGVVTTRAAFGELRLSYSSTTDRTYVRDDASDFLFSLEGNHLGIQDSGFLF